MKRPKHAITQAEIARKAGVSQAAVSAILSGSGVVNVSDETRANILAAAEKLGYVSRKPSAKRVGDDHRRQSVLIVEADPRKTAANDEWVENAYQTFMGKILTTSGLHLGARDIGLSLFHLDDPNKLIQWLADSDVAGVLWHANDSDSSLLHWVASRFPLVLLNREWHASIPFDMVSVDQEKNMLLAAEHLWSLGHRRICTFGHCPANSFYRRRVAAYRRFVEEKGLRNYTEFQAIPDDLNRPAADKIADILATWKRLGGEAPTALVTSDVFALPLLQEARRSGISIPADLSVIGIDNTSPCSLVEPPLTSLEEPFEEMCRVAVDLLLRRMANRAEPGHSVQIAPRLVTRQSVHALIAPAPGNTPALR